ncbi:MAG TPA: aldose 1-epimerase [Acetobacteraceae bacterium]|nr:aldose 1-epimerase [Acetobacteraceae bacterium]
MLSLRAGEASLVLAPEIGGAIVGWTLGRDHVLRPPLSDALVHGAARGMAAYPLVPYSNRIKDARFAWAGCEYQLVRNFGDEPHAIHGVGWTSVWDVTALSAAAARLSLAWRPQTEAQRRSWPFAFDADYRYALRPDGLELEMAITSRHSEPAPAGLGLHPFFPRTEAATLRFAAARVWRNGADHMPAALVPVPPEWDHRAARAVGSAALDNLFEAWDGVAEIVLAPTPVRVRLSADAALCRLVVYIPPGKPYFATEPVSHATNAINRPNEDTGLRTLAPGETFSAHIGFNLF